MNERLVWAGCAVFLLAVGFLSWEGAWSEKLSAGIVTVVLYPALLLVGFILAIGAFIAWERFTGRHREGHLRYALRAGRMGNEAESVARLDAIMRGEKYTDAFEREPRIMRDFVDEVRKEDSPIRRHALRVLLRHAPRTPELEALLAETAGLLDADEQRHWRSWLDRRPPRENYRGV